MKNSLYLKLLLLVLLTAFSCKKEQDPCAGITQANAEFQIQTAYEGYVPTDGFKWYEFTKNYAPGKVKFDLANKNCDSVWWKIGNDPRVFREKTVLLDFHVTGKFDVRCIVYDQKSIQCTQDDGYDTVVKSFEIFPRELSPAKGRFKGYFGNDPNKTMKEILIDTGDLYPNYLYIKNFPDSACDFTKIYGNSERFNIWDGFIHDHNVTYISAVGIVHGTTNCDCLEAVFGGPKVESINQIPTIFWEDGYQKMKIRFWKRNQDIPNPSMEEVWFYGERVQ